MKAFNQFFEMSKKNKLFVVVIIAICLGIVELTTHFFSNEMPRFLTGDAAPQVVAVVQTVHADVRQKPVEDSGWYKAEPQSDILRGDAVYSGAQSNSKIKMLSGGVLELGDETLVIFDDVDGVTVPDVARGKVRLKVTGDMKIAISGQMTEFSGAQSELELSANGKQSTVRTLSGKVAVARKGASIRNLVTGQEMDIPHSKDMKEFTNIKIPQASDLISEIRISQKRKVAVRPTPSISETVATKPVVPEPVVAEPVAAPLEPIAPVVAPIPTPVPVATPPAELAVVPTPAPPPSVVESLSVNEPEQKIDRVMKVQEVYQRNGRNALVPRSGLKTLKVPVALAWNGAGDEEKVFVQVSKDKTFANPWTERATQGRNVVIQEWKPGRNFWRVSRDRQKWSEPATVMVKPTVAVQQNPAITVFKKNVLVHAKGAGPEAQAKLRFQDSGLPKARGWVLQGSTKPEFTVQKTKTVYVTDSRVDIPIARPGKYFFRVRSVGSAGEISSFSSPVEVNATKAIAPPVLIRQAKAPAPKETEREIANVEQEKEPVADALADDEYSKAEDVIERPAARQATTMKTVEAPDHRPRPWSVTIEGGETALVSSEQLANSTDPASVHVIGLRGTYHDGRNTVTAAYHGKFGAANATGSAQGNSRIEARYTRWWQMKWHWLRLGWQGGLSSYDNSSSTSFSKGYTVAKMGLGVDIGLADKWKTGGGILAGTWTDSNTLVELGGFLSYDIRPELAFGVGYRVTLFEAGTQSAAPVPLPYREAMGEAYSSLKYSF